ncbi:hypothetical protein J132_04999 [Termitomyces sp. J132]|nr:hypothetical protein H2248_011929 [Termitomyces sp. 'cryptogamus']KNZ77631.1 hypothetical protein J132_04999 [Termitomyces sp. J132]
MPDDNQPGSSPEPMESQPQSSDAALAGMMTMFRAFAALANQLPGLTLSLTGGTQPIPHAAFPAFMSTDQASAGKSLPALFPAIEASMLLDIAHHEFRPMDLCKLNPTSKFRRTEMERTDTNGPRITGTKDYPSFHALLIPLSTYFSVLQPFVASSGDANATFVIGHGAARYLSHLASLNQKYEWAAVLQYHIHFHLNRRQEMLAGSYTGWARPDDLLLTEFCLGNARALAASRKTVGKRKRDISTETCFAFNKGTCSTSPCPDGRIHKCRRCSKDHSEKDCKKA